MGLTVLLYEVQNLTSLHLSNRRSLKHGAHFVCHTLHEIGPALLVNALSRPLVEELSDPESVLSAALLLVSSGMSASASSPCHLHALLPTTECLALLLKSECLARNCILHGIVVVLRVGNDAT